jgi:hypothetical protein
VDELEAAADGRFDFGPLTRATRELVARTDALAVRLAELGKGAPDADRLEGANATLMRLSRWLIPLAYTSGDCFRHDLALPLPPLAGLAPARRLARLDPGSDAFKFTGAALVQERNRVVHGLEQAALAIDELLTRKESL